VKHVQEHLDQSERRVCQVLGQVRSTQRYTHVQRDGEAQLLKRMYELVRKHPRRGYRMVWGTLRLEGWRVNRKRIHRLWRQEGFEVPRKQHKKRRLGQSKNGILRLRPEYPNHVLCVDFIHDRDKKNRPLKYLSVVDEYTRVSPALEVERSMTSEDVVQILMRVFRERGIPTHIRSDNGGEFIAQAIARLEEITGMKMLYIEPGSPWENGYAESFHSRLRNELLNTEEFTDLADAKAQAAAWHNEYNNYRPHSSLGYLPPAVYAAKLKAKANKAREEAAAPPASVERGDEAPLPSQTHPSTPHEQPVFALRETNTMNGLS
jgi:transposase InsO family protein